MTLDPRFLIPLALMVAGLLLFHHDVLLEDSPPLFKKSCSFFSFFCLTIGIGWLYTSAHRNPKRAVLKILDWALIGFFLCMMSVFEILGLPPIFTVPFVSNLIAARFYATWYLKKDNLQVFDLALLFTFLGVGLTLAILGELGSISRSTGLTQGNFSPLVAVGICLTLVRLIVTWWRWKKVKGEV